MLESLNQSEQQELSEQIELLGGARCWLCAASGPIYLQVVTALKLAKKAGAIKDEEDCKSIAKDSARLSEVLEKVLPGQAGLIASIVSFGAKACGECACKLAF